MVDLVAVRLDGFERHRAPANLVLKVGQRLLNRLAAALVGRLEVRDHDRHVVQFADRDEHIRQRRRGDNREVRVANRLGLGVLEVRRQFVQQDEQRLAAEQVFPCLLARRLKRRVVVLELLLLAQLVCDRAPDAERRVALAARKADDADFPKPRVLVVLAHDPAAHVRVLREQTERDHVVRLAAAHRLREQERALLGPALEAPEGLAEEDPHVSRAVVLLKEHPWLNAVFNEVGDVENGVASVPVEDAVARGTELPKGVHAVAEVASRDQRRREQS